MEILICIDTDYVSPGDGLCVTRNQKELREKPLDEVMKI